MNDITSVLRFLWAGLQSKFPFNQSASDDYLLLYSFLFLQHPSDHLPHKVPIRVILDKIVQIRVIQSALFDRHSLVYVCLSILLKGFYVLHNKGIDMVELKSALTLESE